MQAMYDYQVAAQGVSVAFSSSSRLKLIKSHAQEDQGFLLKKSQDLFCMPLS